MTLLCVTSVMSGRMCVVHEQHLPACDGDDCRGCLPRPAEVGMLCWSCFEKWDQAVRDFPDLVTHLRSVQRGPGSVDGVRVPHGSKVILPASWIAADELWVALAEVTIRYAIAARVPEPEWPAGTTVLTGFHPTASLSKVAQAATNLTRWVSADLAGVIAREAPAKAAVRFFREMQRALHRYPTEDHAVRVDRLRCRRCGLFTVRDHPPLDYLEERVLRCEQCGAETDTVMAGWDVTVYAEEAWGALTAEQRAWLLPRLKDDERRTVTRFSRDDTTRARTEVWDRLGVEYGRTGRVIWFNTPRPEWGGMNADQMIESGHTDRVLAAIDGKEVPA